MEKYNGNFKLISIVSILTVLLLNSFFLGQKSFAATVNDHSDFDNSQHKTTMPVNGSTEITFIKQDNSVINWDNPLTKDDGNTFGMKASFQLSNINEIIERVSNGEIPSIPQSQLNFIPSLKRQALISGSFDLSIDLNQGLGSYFSVNQSVLNEIIANPNVLFSNNPAFSNVFDITSVSENNNIISIKVSVKDGVTGGNILDLADNFSTLDFTVNNLFVLTPSLWNDVNEINRGEFAQLVKIYAPEDEAIFIVKIPSNLVFFASLVGARNPYVGVKLTMAPGYGSLNLGFVVVYDGNGNTSGTAPIDVLSPYNDGSTVLIKTSETLEKENSRFIGWSTDQTYISGQSTLYQPNESFVVNKNIILYAQWEEAFKLSYDLNDDSSSPANRNGGVAYEMLAPDSLVINAPHYTNTPVREGFNFKGWYLDKEGQIPVNPDLAITNDVTVYAKWEKIDEKKQIPQDKPKSDGSSEINKPTNNVKSDGLPNTGENNSLLLILIGMFILLFTAISVKKLIKGRS